MSIRVIVVDDSAMIRQLLSEIINAQPDMCVVATAPDPYVARELIKHHNPDVITLDVEMPKMNGLEFLERLMRLRPTPVLMVSSQTLRGSEATLRALELGAVDFVAKPIAAVHDGLAAMSEQLVDKLRAVAQAKVRRLVAADASVRQAAEAALPHLASPLVATEKLIVVGASTGGCEAITALLERLPPDMPALCITQHMPPGFTRSFAARLDRIVKLRVTEAEDGERITAGHAYIAPGGRHLLVARRDGHYVVELSDGPPVSRHRPSVDVLFSSAATVVGKNALGVILTGMGDDGAQGLRALHDAGAYTIAEDQATCVVFGMPKAAIAAGGVDATVRLEAIPAALMSKLATFSPRAIRL